MVKILSSIEDNEFFKCNLTITVKKVHSGTSMMYMSKREQKNLICTSTRHLSLENILLL